MRSQARESAAPQRPAAKSPGSATPTPVRQPGHRDSVLRAMGNASMAAAGEGLSGPGMPLPPQLRLAMEQAFADVSTVAVPGPGETISMPGDAGEREATATAARVTSASARPAVAEGPDFSGVRIHTGSTAHTAARAIAARAYTVGDDIAFAAGRYQPDTSAGRALLAHELTHVMQQRQHNAVVIQRDADSDIDQWAAEQEADEYSIAKNEAMRRSFRRRSDLAIRQAAAAVAAAPSEAEFVAQVRRIVRDSHTVEDAQDAELFIDLSVKLYGRAHRYDSDATFFLAQGLKREYADESAEAELTARHDRVKQVAEEIDKSPTRQENLRWEDQVAALAAETGLDPGFVSEFLNAYLEAQKPRNPGIIDPRGVHTPYKHAGAPLSTVAEPILKVLEVIKGLLPGIGLFEGISGRDVITGRELPLWERLLGAATDLIPLAGKAVGRAATIAVRGVMAAGRAARVVGTAALDWAVTALRLRVAPAAMLRYISRLGRVSLDLIKDLYNRIAAAVRARRAARLSTADRRLLSEVQDTNAGLLGVGTPRRPRRELTPELAEQARNVHPGLPAVLERFPKVATDADTLYEVGQLLRSTGRSAATYKRVRAASGELAVLEQLQRADVVEQIAMLRPGRGRRTPDLVMTTRTGDRYHVEVTTPTLAVDHQRGPARAMQGGVRQTPPLNKTREPTTDNIKAAFVRKLGDTPQVSAAQPGIVVVNVQRLPSGGSALTRAEVAELEALIATRPYIRELLISVPGPGGRTLLRVGSRDSGLGLASGTLTGSP